MVAQTITETGIDGLDLILDGGPTPGGQASTILDLTGEHPTILRRGLLPAAALDPFIRGLSDRPL